MDGVEQQEISGPVEVVQIMIRSDGRVVWVNVDGVCRLRINQVTGAVMVEGENFQHEQTVQ